MYYSTLLDQLLGRPFASIPSQGAPRSVLGFPENFSLSASLFHLRFDQTCIIQPGGNLLWKWGRKEASSGWWLGEVAKQQALFWGGRKVLCFRRWNPKTLCSVALWALFEQGIARQFLIKITEYMVRAVQMQRYQLQ